MQLFTLLPIILILQQLKPIDNFHFLPLRIASLRAYKITLSGITSRGPSTQGNSRESSSASGLVHRSVFDGGAYSDHGKVELLDYILTVNPTMKKSTAKKFLQLNGVFVNGEAQSQFNLPLIKGDLIEVRSGKSDSAKTSKSRIDILFEDEDIIVVNKAAGVSLSKKKVTSAADPSQDRVRETDSLHELIHQYFARQKKIVSKAYSVSQLDNEMSGIVVFAKNLEALRTLKSSWYANGICVVCVSKGIPRPPTGIFEAKSEKKSSINVRYRVVLSKKDSIISEGVSLMELYPDAETMNHIAPVLLEAGFPVLGDRSVNAADSVPNPLRRMALHCSEIKMNHPTTGDLLVLQATLPPSFQIFMSSSSTFPSRDESKNKSLHIDSIPSTTSSNLKFISVNEFLGRSATKSI